MIRIRVKPTHITIRIDGGEKQKYSSAIQALHVIRVAMTGEGQGIGKSPKTRASLVMCVRRANEELKAAISDVAIEMARADGDMPLEEEIRCLL